MTDKVQKIREKVEKLNTENINGEIFIETTGFSYYTVEFTYEDKEYVLKIYDKNDVNKATAAETKEKTTEKVETKTVVETVAEVEPTAEEKIQIQKQIKETTLKAYETTTEVETAETEATKIEQTEVETTIH